MEVFGQAIFELAASYLGFKLQLGQVRVGRNLAYLFAITLAGALCGFISAKIYRLQITSQSLQILNLMVSPILLGILMHCLGVIKLRRQQNLLVLDNFVNGFLFALGFAAVRFLVLVVYP